MREIFIQPRETDGTALRNQPGYRSRLKQYGTPSNSRLADRVHAMLSVEPMQPSPLIPRLNRSQVFAPGVRGIRNLLGFALLAFAVSGALLPLYRNFLTPSLWTFSLPLIITAAIAIGWKGYSLLRR